MSLKLETGIILIRGEFVEIMNIMSCLMNYCFKEKREKIIYSGFWDVPLGFVVTHKGTQYYFGRYFDEQIEEWCDDYEVYLLPGLSEAEVIQSWLNLEDLTTAYLGNVPINKVHFDDSMPREISTSVFYEMDIFRNKPGFEKSTIR